MPTIDAATVRAVFEADIADLVRNTARAADAVESMASKSDTSAKKMSHGIGVAGAAIATALGMAAKASIDNTLAFEKSMTSISALVGATDAEMEQYTETVRRVGVETGVGAKQAADAMYFLTSSGLDAADAMDALDVTAKASAAGLGDQARIADAVTSAMNAYSQSGMTAGKATDIMVAAVREGKVEAGAFASEIGSVIPVASAFGVSFEEVAASMAGMSLQGISAGEGATRLSHAMRAMFAPSKRAETVMREFGVSGEILRKTLAEQGLQGAFERLTGAFVGNEHALTRAMGTSEGAQAVMALTGQNAAAVATIFDEVSNSAGDMSAAYEKVAETSGAKLSRAMAELQDASIDVGATLVPVAATVVSSLSGMVSGFTDLPPSAQAALGSIAAVAAGIGPAKKAIDTLTDSFSSLRGAFAGGAAAGPVGLVATAAIAGAAALFMEYRANAEDARDRQEALTQALVDANDPATVLAFKYHEMVAAMEMVPPAADKGTEAIESMGMAARIAEEIGPKLGEAFAAIGRDAQSLVSVVETGTDVFDKLADTPVDSWAQEMTVSLKDASGAERELVESMWAAYEAGDISANQLQDMAGALDELADSQDDHIGKLTEMAKADVGSALAKDASLKVIVDQALATSTATTELGRYQDALAAVENVQAMFAPPDMGPTATGMADAAQATLDMEQAEKDAAEEAEALEKAIKDLGKEIDAYLGTMFNVPAAMDEVQGALLGMAEALAENGSSTHGMTEEAIKNREILRGWTSDVGDLIGAMQEQGATTEDQTATLAGLADMYGETMRAAGLSEEEIAAWTETVRAIPVGNPGLLAQERLLRDAGSAAGAAAGEVDGVGAALAGLNGATAVVTVHAETGAAYEALNAFYSTAVSTIAAIPWTSASAVPASTRPATRPWAKMAEGGHIGPGDNALVGEDGPEAAVWRNGGVDIIPMDGIAGSSMGASGGGGMGKTGGGDTYIIQAHPDSRGQYEGRRVYDGLTREKRRRGGELAVTG